jgi:hypothetical protein
MAAKQHIPQHEKHKEKIVRYMQNAKTTLMAQSAALMVMPFRLTSGSCFSNLGKKNPMRNSEDPRYNVTHNIPPAEMHPFQFQPTSPHYTGRKRLGDGTNQYLGQNNIPNINWDKE